MKKVALFFIPLMLWWSCGEEPEDCAGVTGGSAEYDDCGVCNGDNSTCKDCNGDINGLAYENECGCVGGNTGYDPDFCCLDWELIPFETYLYNYNVFDIALNSNNELYLGVYWTATTVTVTGGSIYKSTDNGLSWSNIYMATGDFGYIPHAIFVLNSDTIYAVGSGTPGQVLCKSFDSGNNWIYKTLGNESIPYPEPTSISFINSSIGFVGTANKGILRTVDGGETWSNISGLSNTSINSIIFLTDSIGYALSNDICLKTVDAGISWDTVFQGSSMSLRSIDFIDANTGIIGGNGILKTVDGGLSWSTVFNQEIRSISFQNNNTIYAVTSDGNIHLSEDEGSHWIIDCDSDINCTNVIFNSTTGFVGTGEYYNNPLSGEPMIMRK